MFLEQRIEKLSAELAKAGQIITSLSARVAALEISQNLKVDPDTDPGKVHLIIAQLSVDHHLEMGQLTGPSRGADLVWVRHMAIHLIRHFTTLSCNSISKLFKRDHGAVLHALKNVRNIMETEPKRRAQVEKYLSEFKIRFEQGPESVSTQPQENQ